MPASDHTMPAAEQRGAGRPVLSPLLVAYDGSDGANGAAAFGLWLAAKAGCRTTLAHVVPSREAGASAELLPVGASNKTASTAPAWRP